MKHPILYLLLGFLSCQAVGQKTAGANEYLSPSEVSKLFPDSVCKALHINFHIFRVFHYTDTSGEYYCALTEHRYGILPDQDTVFDKIRAVNLRMDSGRFSQ